MSAQARCSDPRVERIVNAFEQLQRDDVVGLADLYAVDARFKDPFNEVQGVGPIQAIFAHMFVALNEPRFVVYDIIMQGDQCFLTWDFIFRFKRFSSDLQTVRGSSHLKLNAQGLIALHRDYWDAAEELYEKLPVVASVMRWLKRRANS